MVEPEAPRNRARGKRKLTLSVIVPVFNEEQSVGHFLERTEAVLATLLPKIRSSYIFVNDGSVDGTLHRLRELKKSNPRISIIDLSRNFGKEAAMTAGLDACETDAAVIIDVDTQDPPELIPALVEKWLEGFDVVAARRSDRSSDSSLKRNSAALFYRIHNVLSSISIPENVGDFRLMDRRVMDALKLLPERRRFMKGLFAWVGFKTAHVDYVREKRALGVTKFSPWKLWNFAIEGITSFSNVPLEMWSYVGGIVSFGSLCYGAVIFFRTLIFGIEVPGYASLMVAVLFLGGVQLLGIGILGQYIGRVYLEAKQRPIYVIRDRY